jgi:hypothetical protein
LAVRSDATEACIDARRALIAQRLRGVLAEALHAGLTAEQIRHTLDDQLSELDGTVATVASLPDPPASQSANQESSS